MPHNLTPEECQQLIKTTGIFTSHIERKIAKMH